MTSFNHSVQIETMFINSKPVIIGKVSYGGRLPRDYQREWGQDIDGGRKNKGVMTEKFPPLALTAEEMKYCEPLPTATTGKIKVGKNIEIVFEFKEFKRSRQE